jgi:glycosyltransferase involved in cell wall biosynthesis
MDLQHSAPLLTEEASRASVRPQVRGKFLFVGDRKLYVKGVTYGTFRPQQDGTQYGDPETVARDFAMMAANGINAVRTYTVPPHWLLDLAYEHGLYIMVGLPWEQHITFLDEPGRAEEILTRIGVEVRQSAGHPAILCYAVGNEIPAPIVRWHGAQRIERFIEQLYKVAKKEDPEALVTYVNFPSTEFLSLPFLDFVCFNVYLEKQDRLEAYLARLQSLAGDRPLVMAEIGLDSRRNGFEKQAEALDWQVRSTFAAGCAGAFLFSWTDEWYRGGYEIDDWDFGLTTRDRLAKPVLAAVRRAFADVPFPATTRWPEISVVVCSYNGSRTIRDTCEGLLDLEYPNYEVIVVDDGSTDRLAEIVKEYPFHLIRTENRGLSNARNTGMEAASGEIVAYIDDDAYPDPHWLHYLAMTYMTTDHVAVGGPNIPPPGDGPLADCVANAPGGPVHVLVSDTEAEHIPGCNMSIRKAALEAIGGFDPRFRAAGDDVDVCWRLMQCGGTIGFSPSAVVWHHRRNSIRMYWKQQQGYGKAEALLEEKWPEKYNSAGHVAWAGRLYGNGITRMLSFRQSRIYHGTWGSAPFQSIYEPASGLLRALPLMPEWYLMIFALAMASLLGLFWAPLLLALPVLVLAVAAVVAQGVRSAMEAKFITPVRSFLTLPALYCLTAILHMAQPIARLRGRIRFGLTLWRRRGISKTGVPRMRRTIVWSESWGDANDWLRQVEDRLKQAGGIVLRGGDFDRWDLELRGGVFGRARTLMTVEEHGGGRQMLRFKTWPRLTARTLLFIIPPLILAALAALDHAWVPALVITIATSVVVGWVLSDCAAALGTLTAVLPSIVDQPEVAEAAEQETVELKKLRSIQSELEEALSQLNLFSSESPAASERIVPLSNGKQKIVPAPEPEENGSTGKNGRIT